MFHQRDCLVQQLENQEFFQLECQEKLAILRGLCLRVMATYSVQDYMEEKQREAIQLTYVLPQGLGVERIPSLEGSQVCLGVGMSFGLFVAVFVLFFYSEG